MKQIVKISGQENFMEDHHTEQDTDHSDSQIILETDEHIFSFISHYSRASELRSLSSESEESDVTMDSDDTSESDNSLDGAEFGANGSNEDPDDGEDVAIYEHYDADGQLEIQQLRKWAIKRKIFSSHLDELLAILRPRLLPDLPKCAKTFLGTTGAQYNIIAMQDKKGSVGEFVYLGLAKGLSACINPDLHLNNVIDLQVNVDEIPLVKSGNQEFCPILCKVHCDIDVYEPFPAAIYFGESKPGDLNSYLAEFVDEINYLQRNGIEISGNHFHVTLKCFICDTPARAFMKSTVGHGGRNACERCTVEGIRLEGRTVFPSVIAE